MKPSSSNSAASPEARGQRLRLIRQGLRLSRKDFTAKYKIPAASIQNWEDARYGGLTEKGAKKMVEAFQAEGVRCSLEWLFYGLGEEPVVPNVFIKAMDHQNFLTDEAIVAQELKLFHQLNKEAVDAVITDDSMEPYFTMGDRVAGQRYFDDEISQVLDHICIVQTLAGKVLVRRIQSGSKPGVYNLVCLNSHTKILDPILKDIQIFSAAPILWIRKPNLPKN